MKKYYLQLYRQNIIPMEQRDMAAADEVLYQPLLIERLIDIGAIESKGGMCSYEEVERVNKILRLRRFFGVNLSGAAIIVELLDKLEAMEEAAERQKTD